MIACAAYNPATFSTEQQERWDAFVAAHHGNYCQRAAWINILARSYDLDVTALVLSDQDEWIALLPYAIKPGPGDACAISLPYCNYGGFLISAHADAEKAKKAALSHLKEKGISRLEVRELAESLSPSNEVTMILDLPETSDLLWKKVGVKVRNQVKKAEKSDLTVRWGKEQAQDLYNIYAENMGRLGTPVHAKSFLTNILDCFGEGADILTVRLGDNPIAAMLVLKDGKTWIDPIASSRASFKHLNPNMLLYWEALRHATASGAKFFDFGRSHRNAGTYNFKRQWGAEERSLDYHSFVNGERISAASTDLYRGKKAEYFATAWRLLPTPLQLLLGPLVRKYIP